MPLGIVFATSFTGLFSRGSKLPWKCPPDLAYFRALTKGTNIVMGRKTSDSLPSSLPNRNNLVLSRSEFSREDFSQISMKELQDLWKKEDVFIIGGYEIIKYFFENHFEEIDMISHTKIDIESYPSEEITDDNTTYLDVEKLDLSYMFELQAFDLSKGVRLHLYKKRDKILSSLDKQYLDLGCSILKNPPREGRNGLTRSSFDPEFIISTDFKDGFPILNSKFVWMKGVKEELDFFWDGKTDTKELEEKGVKIWSDNTSEKFIESLGKSDTLKPGEMGPMYGYQWRRFGAKYHSDEPGVDQLEELIEGILKDPHGRRHLLTTYNPAQAKEGVLFACHGICTQFYVESDSKISLKTYQRSADWFLGVPFNLSSYAYFLLRIIEELNKRTSESKFEPGKVTTIFGDAHIYEIHVPIFAAQYCFAQFTGKMDLSPVKFNIKTGMVENYNPVKKYVAPMVA